MRNGPGRCWRWPTEGKPPIDLRPTIRARPPPAGSRRNFLDVRRRVRASFPARSSLSRLEQFRASKLSQIALVVRLRFALGASVLSLSAKWWPIFFMTDKSCSRKENRQKATLNRLRPHDKSFLGICLGQRPPHLVHLTFGNEEFPLRSAKPFPNPQEAGLMGSGGPAASLVLEVGRGRTEQRRRPVQSSRFLIGSSQRCDLCLGGGAIPPLHSLISTDGGEVWLEAIAGARNCSSTAASRSACGSRIRTVCGLNPSS